MAEIQLRKKRLIKNTISSIIFQIVSIVCGFVLPRLILKYYGSDINGLVNSIAQFLSLISFVEFGVGAVIQSSLYKPLADKNIILISQILVSGEKFFKHIARLLMIYVIGLVIFYPILAHQNFDYMFTATLIVSMSVSSFSQYYFGVVDRLLLTADQKGYIQYNAQTLTLIVNTLLCMMLIKTGSSIQFVKLITSLVYLTRPVVLRIYVNSHYNIDRKAQYSKEPIEQKWNGVAQHVAAVVLDNTDTVVLTLFDNLVDVSIYSVYHLIIYGIKTLLISSTNGMQALLGDLYARNKLNELRTSFNWFEWILHTSVVFWFGCAGILILPFVKIYTAGITDANYIQPIFAYLLLSAHAGHCLRLPYNNMILAAGRYKQTQNNYIVAALLNVIISIATVKMWGLIGVAIGTLVAMVYQTIWMAIYNSKHILNYSIGIFVKQICVDLLTIFIGAKFSQKVSLESLSYSMWVVMALKVMGIWIIVIILMNCIFYKERTKVLFNKIGHIINLKSKSNRL